MQVLDLEKILQSLEYTITDTSDPGDRTSNESRGLETLNCLFPCCKASFMDDKALSLHVGSHLDMLPSATDGSFELIRNEQYSLQKAMEATGKIMRWYKNIDCSKGESIKRLLRPLNVVLAELKELAERLGSNSGYTPHGMGNEEGTEVGKWRLLSYASFQTFQKGLVKATERARLKIDSPMRCDLEWYKLEKYSHSPAIHTVSVEERDLSLTTYPFVGTVRDLIVKNSAYSISLVLFWARSCAPRSNGCLSNHYNSAFLQLWTKASYTCFRLSTNW